MNGRLVVVSNRLPLTLRRTSGRWAAEPSAGGLATALTPVLRRTGGLWIGWPGDHPGDPDPQRAEAVARLQREHGFVAVELEKTLAARFYHGYANETIWPLFHQFPGDMAYDALGWPAYVEANERFRDVILGQLRPGDLVWVHDYHLMLLPRLLRAARPELAIGFFLHVPFPASDLFRIVPGRDELLLGLLGADLVAFQTHGHLQQFRASLQRVLGISSEMDRVAADGRVVRLEARPIGIAPESFAEELAGRVAQVELAHLRERYAGRRLLIAVDRLDYTKGIPERLRTLRRLLEQAPQLRGQLVLVQVAVPSRERIPRYRQLRREVNGLVGEVNGAFGTPDWTPIVYIHRALPRHELVALYAAADVGWVTPLRDGMNLVAKEYVACQQGEAGVLVLSEFAGAAAEMGEAVLVNPYDEERTAAALRFALLELPLEERRERMAALWRRITRNNVFAWADRFLESLASAAAGRAPGHAGAPLGLPRAELVEAFRAAHAGELVLDYDGTLVPFARTPSEARPGAGLVGLLSRLNPHGRHRVAVVSGRRRADLERFLSGTDGVWLAAEHGVLVRPAGASDWRALRPAPQSDWKQRVRQLLEHFVDRTPGSFVEEKEYSLVWHFRMADPVFGEWLANELAQNLDELLAQTELHAVRGHKLVEVKHVWANKGEVVPLLESAGPVPDFRLAIGDDRTDEDLFRAMPDGSWTVHVGLGASQARYRLDGPRDVWRLLEALAAAAA